MFDEIASSVVKVLAVKLRFRSAGGFRGCAGLTSNLSGGGHGVEGAAHNLGSASAVGLVGSFGLEEFGVGQDDSKLVVEAMEEQLHLGRLTHLSPRQQLVDFPRTNQTRFRPSVCHTGSTAGCSARWGSRHSVSAQIATHPPAGGTS